MRAALVLSSNGVGLVNQYGLQGAETAVVIAVTEVTEDLGRADSENLSAFTKNVIGQDGMFVNRKWGMPLQGHVMRAALVLSSNGVPRLPDTGGSVSGKMVVAKFKKSFLGKENPNLDAELGKEVDGVARWALEGAMALVREKDPNKWFPMTESGKEELGKFRVKNSPADAFLEECCGKSAGNRVTLSFLYQVYRGWARQERLGKGKVPLNRFRAWLTTETTWGLEEYRTREGERGLQGLYVKREWLSGTDD
jgi:phage/plasmid-associated DNA primase